MKRPFFTGVLLPMTMMMLASCSSCSTSDDDPTPAPPKSKCIVAGYSNAGALSSVSPADYPDMKYPTRVYCFGISPDTEGAWFVDTQREQRQNAVRAAMNSSQEAFLVVGGGATAGNMYRMGTDPAKRAAFAEALVKYAHERDFDGIDVDWETDWSEEPFLHVPEDDMVALTDLYLGRADFNPENVVLFGYSFAFTETEMLRKNLMTLSDSVKNLRVNIDIRY